MSIRVSSATAVAPREGAHVIEMQRRRLLLAMRELAGESGLADASVGAVCKRSRISRRTFYDLFEDRDACFLAAFEQALGELAERVLPVFERSGRWRDRIRAALTELLICFDEQPRLAQLCVVETLRAVPAVLARRREILDALAGAVDRGREEARSGSVPPALAAESAVGGALAVVHARLFAGPAVAKDSSAEPARGALVDLAPALTGMIVLPYLGAAASQRELERPAPLASRAGLGRTSIEQSAEVTTDPFRDLPLRFTYRTARVLAAIAVAPGASNRQIGDAAGAPDQGQMSKLLKRLQQAGLIENGGSGREAGEPNAWQLTARGAAIHTALGTARS